MHRTLLILLTLLSTTSFSQKFKLYNGDTINYIDFNNQKQGLWLIFNKTDKTIKVEEGKYVNNKKEGIWKKYYPGGKIKHEITYISNKPNGNAKFYYENGNISEEGIWKGNKWIGNYKFYHDNGKPSYEWTYSEKGKRTGTQKYYHKNGNLMIEGEWTEGKEIGIIKEYYEDGTIKSKKDFKDGKFDVASAKFYNKDLSPKDTVIVKEHIVNDKVSVGVFDGNGFHKTYNKQKKLQREGEFKNGKLIDGKRYYYNSEGKLIKTSIYRYGKVVDVIYEDEE